MQLNWHKTKNLEIGELKQGNLMTFLHAYLLHVRLEGIPISTCDRSVHELASTLICFVTHWRVNPFLFNQSFDDYE